MSTLKLFAALLAVSMISAFETTSLVSSGFEKSSSGLRKLLQDSPPSSPSIQDCEEDGQQAASFAAQAACTAVVRICDPLEPPVAFAQDASDPLQDIFNAACNVIIRNRCADFARLQVSDATCRVILENGPPGEGQPDCMSAADAVAIFNREVLDICSP